MKNEIQHEKIVYSAYSALKKALSIVPFNRNSSYVKVHMNNARCDLYIPIIPRDEVTANAIKGAYQDLINAAEL